MKLFMSAIIAASLLLVGITSAVEKCTPWGGNS